MSYDITSNRGQKMLEYLPKYYETSRVMRSVMQGEGKEFDYLRTALDDTLTQFFARTATWSLDRWENELGLVSGVDQTNEERRDRIVSRLRGHGTATIYLVKNVAEAYEKGRVNVVQNHTEYEIIIKFVDTAGVPPNIDDLKNALRAVVPAHLDIIYKYNYLTWDELDDKTITWDELDAKKLTWNEFEEWQTDTKTSSTNTALTFAEQ